MSVSSSKSGSGLSAGPVEIRVSSAGSGEIALLQLAAEEDPLVNFKRQVQRAFGIDAAEQIILAGPPYKPLTSLDRWLTRSRLQSSRHEENIFVYNRKFFSKSASSPPPVVLEPAENSVPDKSSVECSESVLAVCGSQNPLLAAVPSFEQSFKYEAIKAEILAEAAARTLQSCEDSLQRQQVQAEALQAAVSNLSDYYDTAKSTFRDTALQFRQLQYTHAELLASFDKNFHKLSQVKLHKSLRTESRTTLMDCIPAEKVQQYKSECATKHERVEGLLNELDKYFDQVSQGVQACTQNDTAGPMRFGELRQLLSELTALVNAQQSDAPTVRQYYESAKRSILEALQHQPGDDGLRKAVPEVLSRLDTLHSDQVAPIARALEERSGKILEIKATFEASHSALQELLFSTLRKVSQLQYTIQQVTAYLTTLKRARPTQEEAFQHLEHIISLPSAYQGFLAEIMRRRLYLRVFESKVQNATNDLAEFRNQETKLREEFMREHGRKLPPLFLELVPSLQEKPPFFSPNITQSTSQWLPEITVEDVLEANEQALSVSLHAEDSAKLREMLEALESKVTAPKEEEDGGGSLIFNEDPAFAQNAQERYHAMEYQNSLLLGRVSSMSARIEQLEAQLQQAGLSIPNVSSESKQSVEQLPTVAQAPAAVAQDSHPVDSGDKTAQELKDICSALEAVIAEDPPLWGTQPEVDSSEPLSDFARAMGLIRHVQTSAKDAVEHLQQQLQRSNAECERLSQQVGSNALAPPKIAFREFNVGDVALFMPTSPHDPKIYVAFHMACPHRYLSPHSLEAFKQQRANRVPEYVLGRIVFIESARATPDDNPFSVPVGVEYYTLTVESIVRR